MNNRDFAVCLRASLARRRVTQYRLALDCRLSAVTLSRIKNGIRGVTEAQALRIFVGLVVRDGRRGEILDAVEQEPTSYFGWLEGQLAEMSLTSAGAARTAGVGDRRLQEVIAGRQETSEALMLRLAIVALCTPEEIDTANLMLQAGGFYIISADRPSRRTA